MTNLDVVPFHFCMNLVSFFQFLTFSQSLIDQDKPAKFDIYQGHVVGIISIQPNQHTKVLFVHHGSNNLIRHRGMVVLMIEFKFFQGTLEFDGHGIEIIRNIPNMEFKHGIFPILEGCFL